MRKVPIIWNALLAEYMHKGDKTTLLEEVTPRILMGENNFDFIYFYNTDLFVLHN